MNYIYEYPGSAIFYTCVIVFATIIAKVAEKRKVKSKLLIILIVILLSLVSGIRNETVGIDTAGYINESFFIIADGNFDRAYGEVGYKIICYMLMFISNNSVWFTLFGLALLTHGLIIIRYCDFADSNKLSQMVFLYLCLNYLPSMNGMAQYLSSAILFWSTRYLNKQEYFKYFIGIFFATTIHATAAIGIVFFFVHLLTERTLVKKQRITIVCILCLIPIIAIVGYNYLMTYTKFANYFTTYLSMQTINLGIMVPVKLSILIILFVVLLSRKKTCKQINSSMQKTYDNGMFTASLCIIGTGLQGVGYFYRYLDRLGMSFSFFEPILVSRKSWVKNGIFVQVLRWILILAAIYTYFIEISTNGNGAMPYSIM